MDVRVAEKKNETIPLVGVILVTYNGYEDTIECLKSLEKVTYPAMKIFVIDNASTVQLKVSQKQYITKHSEYIYLNENLGFSGGNNVGIKKALDFGCEYVLLLNNDTIVEKDFLDGLVGHAQSKSDAGCVIGRIMFFSDPEIVWYAGGEYDPKYTAVYHCEWGRQYSDIVQQDYSRSVTFATGCMMLIHRKIVETVGFLSEEYFLYSEDTDYCCRILNSGYKIYYYKDSVIYHKISKSTGETSDLTQYYMFRNKLIIIRKYGKNKWMAYKSIIISTLREIVKGRKRCQPILKASIDFILHKNWTRIRYK